VENAMNLDPTAADAVDDEIGQTEHDQFTPAG